MSPQRTRHSAITQEAIADVIDTFYGRVRHDPMLGPIFARHVENWAPHLLRMNAFWRSVLLRTGEFQRSERGSPPVLHAAVGGLGADHFARWLTLFSAVLEERLEEHPAQTWAGRAKSIGASLLQHVQAGGRSGPDRLETVSS
ncbi:MAG: group III truncated hemoglobin [Nannocystaceae bacterium]|nr:group III truncated hemoglobin [Nannocystaceae bacterium]